MRALLLLILNIKSFFHKLRFDLVEECVVGICSLVLFATFFYIFNDFLNDKIASVSDKMKEHISILSSLILLSVTSYFSSVFIKKESKKIPSFTRFCFSIGESFKIYFSFILIRTLLGLLFLFGISWWIIYRYIHTFSITSFVSLQLVFLASVFFLLKLNFLSSTTRTLCNHDYSRCSSKISTLLRFRLDMIFRSKICLFFLSLSFISSVLVCYFLSISSPIIISMFLCFICGFFIAVTTSCQVKSDLESIWIDRLVGVSQEDFFSTYKRLTFILSGVSFILVSIAVLIVVLKTSEIYSAIDLIKLPFILLVCPYLMPNLIFQIDPKRPIVQILIVFMIGLFLATALWVSWLSILLVFILNYYGRTTQDKRFYRV